MAANDTAALVVALSAQVSKFQSDMDQANGIATKAIDKIESSFSRLNKSISKELSGITAGLSGQLGGFGSILSSIGPVGVGLAASLGSVILAFNELNKEVAAFTERAIKLKEAAQTAGLTSTEFAALAKAGKDVGVDFEKTEAFITKMTVALDQLRSTGQGPLFDALLKINSSLAVEITAARSTAEAIDILAKAYSGLTTQQQRNALVSAAGGGRRDLSSGRTLGAISDAGGVKELTDGFQNAGKIINDELTEKLRAMKIEIESIKRNTENIWGSMFSEEILQLQARAAGFINTIALTVQDIVRHFRDLNGTQRVTQVTVNKPPQIEEEPEANAAVRLGILRARNAAIGDAITPTEQLAEKELALAAAQEKGGVTARDAARGLAAFKLAQEQTLLSTRERLGIATQEEITSTKLAELDALRAKGFVTGADQIVTAERIIAKEAKIAADALQVRGAIFPGLKQFELDAANLAKQLDGLAVTSLNNLGTALGDIALSTVSAADGFRNLATAVIRSVVDMVIRMSILLPIAQSLQSALGGFLPGGGATGSPGGLPFQNNASGTDFSRGGFTIVGERGPELVNLPRGSQVIPNDVLRQGSSGGDINLSMSVDLNGANGDDSIRRMIRTAMNQAVQQSVAIANANAPARQLRFNNLGT